MKVNVTKIFDVCSKINRVVIFFYMNDFKAKSFFFKFCSCSKIFTSLKSKLCLNLCAYCASAVLLVL